MAENKFPALSSLDKPTGPTGILSSSRTPPPSKGTRVVPKNRSGLVNATKPILRPGGRR